MDWVEWFTSARRDPRPERVVRRAARPGEGRHLRLEVLEVAGDVEEIFASKVSAAKWGRMSPAEQREWMAGEIERKTARAEARREGPGRLVVKSTGVKRLRLLLGPDDLPPEGAVVVTLNGRAHRRTVTSDAAVLLREFAATLDRSFLPVAEIAVP
ncbi:MAG: hypothetical protein MUE73_12055 [Planctomycetes bacterium]|nr:hypothetical protein [Planctomycetota bacterium]